MVDNREGRVFLCLHLFFERCDVDRFVCGGFEHIHVDIVDARDFGEARAVGAVVNDKQFSVRRNARAYHSLVGAGARAAEHYGNVIFGIRANFGKALGDFFHKISELKLARANVGDDLRVLYAVRCGGRAGVQKNFAADVPQGFVFLYARPYLLDGALKHCFVVDFCPSVIFDFADIDF